MTRELDSTESQIKDKVNQLLEGLQVLAKTSNELNLHSLVTDLEVLSFKLPGDSNLIKPTYGISNLYDELISVVGLFHTKLTEINLAAQVEP